MVQPNNNNTAAGGGGGQQITVRSLERNGNTIEEWYQDNTVLTKRFINGVPESKYNNNNNNNLL